MRVEWAEDDWFGPGRMTRAASTGAGPADAGARNADPGARNADADAGHLRDEHAGAVEDDLGHATTITVNDRGAAAVEHDVVCSVRAYAERPLMVFTIEATSDISGLATGHYDEPSVGWPVFTPSERRAGGVPSGTRALVFQASEFGFPSGAGTDLDRFFLLPHRPPTGWPLLLGAPDGRTLLLAPLDHFHDQTIGLNSGTVRCGWHGDLERVPKGFATELAVIGGSSPRACLDEWAAILLRRAGTVRPGRWPDALGTRPSYWTDNGAAYWYRTEPGHDVVGSIVAAVDELRAHDVPIGAVQLDSWFYPHAELRPFDTEEWVVPPTAMIAWEARPDVLPAGVADLRERLGRPPLVAHIRHLSADAPIAAEVPVYRDGAYAAPATPEGYARWLDQCLAWGVETFEHDWLVEAYFGVRGLRAEPGRARAWQQGIDRAARERGITLQWCMATPADFAETVTMTQVTSVRTCGDHGYIATPGQLWAWFCTTNALVRALGLMPFKDVFRTDPDVAGTNGELEALLSALSTGPVGLGDRVGRFDHTLALRTCRADGILIKPHVPIAATAGSMFASAGSRPTLMIAETWSDHPAGRWTYVLAMHCHPGHVPTTTRVALSELGEAAPTTEVVIWDWRARTARRAAADDAWDATLDHEAWALWIVAPVLPCGMALIGDVDKFVAAGDARLVVHDRHESDRCADRVQLTVLGAGETVVVTGWAAAPPRCDDAPLTFDAATGVWRVVVDVPSRGWVTIEVLAPAPTSR
ncbi:MAG: hypothetical protein ABIR68_02070 [Ilumatobacteraceae bacterium]